MDTCRDNNDIFDFKLFSGESRDEQFNEQTDDKTNARMIQFRELLYCPEIQSIFRSLIQAEVKAAVEYVLATSESAKNAIADTVFNSDKFKPAVIDILLTEDAGQLPQRTKALEKVAGIYKFEEFEDHKPTIPEKITKIDKRLDKIESNPQACKPIEPKNIIPETKTEVRAVFLKEYFEKEVKERNGEFFLNGSEIKDFLTKIIPERYNPDIKVKEGQNIRKIKKDVLDKASRMFPNILSLNKNKNGRHETRILFKPLQTVPL
jgi:hypothetical protein